MPNSLEADIHCSKNLREQIHCGKLLLKRTVLVLTLTYKRIKINEWEVILWHKSYQKRVDQFFRQFGGCYFPSRNMLQLKEALEVRHGVP